ncbi:MlaA family lipoprotein [Rhodovarius crocodyli]|nr:VacJ family lipoprotein [Rhodovarius crocodyli]
MRIEKLAGSMGLKAKSWIAPVAALALLAGCATAPPATDTEALAEFRATNDPAEPFNRAMFYANGLVDSVTLRPAAQAYRAVVPQPVRTGIRNFLQNARTPVILLNDVLQAEQRRGGDTLGRFVINTTLGLGGIFDVADAWFGVPHHAEDFGQTLAVWGVGSGPYLYLPLLGPTNPRDFVGLGVDIATNPMTWFGQGPTVDAIGYGVVGMTFLDAREGVLDTLDEVARSSLDPYATIRSATRQSRAAAIANGRGSGTTPSDPSTPATPQR